MIRTIALTITLAFALSACFGIGSPFANGIQLDASPKIGAVGDEVTFTAEHGRGEARIRILETEQSIEPPQTVRTLPVLGDATIFVSEDATTLSVTLQEGRNRALGRDIYRYDTAQGTILAFGGERTHTSANADVQLRAEAHDPIRDGIVDATFSIEKLNSGEDLTYLTVEMGTVGEINLDDQSATFEIVEVEINDNELERLVIRTEYNLPLFGRQSKNLNFSLTKGNDITVLSGTYRVFLTEVTYSVIQSDEVDLFLESGSDEASFVIGRPVILAGHTIVPLSLSSKDELQATILVDPEVLIVGSELVRYPDETLDVEHTFDASEGAFTFTDDDADSLFSTYRLEDERTRITDTYSAELIGSGSSSATYRFFVPGDYTARAIVTDDGARIGQAEASVLIT